MRKRILLLEPYTAVADMLLDVLEQLSYETDLVTSGLLDEGDLGSNSYDCVLVNLDQNRTEWHDYGLQMAERASALGFPVVMIPDHHTAASTIDAKGWLRLGKPFTVKNLEAVIARAVGNKQRSTGQGASG